MRQPATALVLMLLFLSLLVLPAPTSGALIPHWRRLVESLGFHSGLGCA